MRAIKFRAWYEPTKEMLQPDKIESINFETKVLGVYLPIENRGFNKLRMSDFELMQYTGIQDRNGVDIYEGDLIHDTEFDKGLGEVYWEEELALWRVKFTVLEDDWLYEYHDCSEIIGNIYENPELLEANHET